LGNGAWNITVGDAPGSREDAIEAAIEAASVGSYVGSNTFANGSVDGIVGADAEDSAAPATRVNPNPVSVHIETANAATKIRLTWTPQCTNKQRTSLVRNSEGVRLSTHP
jgi:hypothetical protein